jgi:hypothetical protein
VFISSVEDISYLSYRTIQFTSHSNNYERIILIKANRLIMYLGITTLGTVNVC